MSMRLISQTNEWINRTKKIRFTFEGQEYEGYEGDTISSALWASGQRILGRSFKYHRPRGILSFANHDVNVMVTDGRDTNMRGDVVTLKSNMNLMAVNTDGGVEKDKNSYIDSISPLLPVGFYYKAFHTPRKLFPFWEKVIRKAAGLGVVNFNYPRELKRKTHEHCDVLVIGAGASGLTAALFAAEAGLNVVLVDENQQAGGALNFDHSGSDTNKKLLEALLSKVAEFPNISLLLGTYAGGYYNDHLVPLVSVDGIIKMRAKSVIVASGAFEQPPVFRNNDLPGVMMGSAAQRLIARYSVKPFNRGVVFTANDYGYRVALDLIAAGVSVAAVVDLRESGGELAKQVISHGVKVLTRSCVYEALPTAKNLGVKGALICGYDEQENIAKPAESSIIECDGIVMCAGWAPAAALLYQAGTGMRYDDGIQQFVPARLPKGVFAAGRVNGVFDAQQKMLDGARAASDALRYLGFAANQVSVLGHEGASPSHAYPIVPHPKGKNFIDFDEDIQLKDFINAAKEGFDNIELMKRFTTVGMGPSQGKHSNMNAIRILARIRNLPVEKIGTTTARPFFHPTPIGHLGGRGLHPHRLTPMHRWNQQADAVFTDVGAWKRAAYYGKAGLSAADCIQQEAGAVRNGVGMIDGSSLGKIEIHGPDASHFLERFFTGSYASQKVGESRYAMMLDESGVLVDDGLLSRMAIDQFYLTIGTSNAAAVYREMQKALQQWQLGVTLVNVTGAVALMNVAGPSSRQTLEKISSIDLSDAAFPLSAVKEIEVAGVKVKIMRVAFVSNLAYEIHVPAAMALHVWEAIFEAGKAFKITPFGTDAQRLLRLEMGHHMPGIDTDGLTNPFEVHADWAIQMGKPYFVGQRSLKIIQKKPVKKCLVAFVLEDHYSGEIPKECNLVIDQGEITGRVTSIAYSKSVGRVIGFAYVNPAKQAIGSEFQIRADSGAIVKAEVVTTPFFKA